MELIQKMPNFHCSIAQEWESIRHDCFQYVLGNILHSQMNICPPKFCIGYALTSWNRIQDKHWTATGSPRSMNPSNKDKHKNTWSTNTTYSTDAEHPPAKKDETTRRHETNRKKRGSGAHDTNSSPVASATAETSETTAPVALQPSRMPPGTVITWSTTR